MVTILPACIGLQNKLRATIVVSEYQPRPRTAADSPTDSNAMGNPVTPRSQRVSDHIGAFLNGRVQNAGRTQLAHVTLTVPGADYACVWRKQTGWLCEGVANAITIGEMPPLDSARVQVWLPYRPNVTVYQEFTLTHSQGVGSIHLKTVDLPAGFVRRNAVLFLFATALGLYALNGYLTERHTARQMALLREK